MSEIPAAVLRIPKIRRLHKKLLKTERKRKMLEEEYSEFENED